jgi:hypothetical protein
MAEGGLNMGVIDQTLIELTCVSCDASERVSVVESGSQYGGSWENPAGMFVGFNSVWTLGFRPELAGAKCLSCGNSDTRATYPDT